jgi:glycosyltransferase involved in cell wall biosynthesis
MSLVHNQQSAPPNIQLRLQPKISIVITCFNYQRYVASAIESAIGQTYKDIEIIVVDDGSTDGSPEVICRYAGRLRSIRQVNSGSIAAYNCGYMASDGDVIIFLDADDLLATTAAEEVASAWNKACVKVQYDLTIIDANGKSFLGRRCCSFQPGYDADRVRGDFQRHGTYHWPVTTGNAYSRWFLEIFMPLTIARAPDGMLNTIAPIYGDVITIPHALGSYRLHGENIWSSNIFARIPERIRHRQNEFEIMREHARLNDKPIPKGNLLNYELTYINYRLMALKAGMDYVGSLSDSPIRLWWLSIKLLVSERLPIHMTFAHFIWFSTLTFAPRFLARGLISLRFNRAAYLARVHAFAQNILRGVTGNVQR